MDGKTENAVKRLKSGKAAGPDGTVSEHLKYGGPVLLRWLTQIFNAIMSLEEIPTIFKQEIMCHRTKVLAKTPKTVEVTGVSH